MLSQEIINAQIAGKAGEVAQDAHLRLIPAPVERKLKKYGA